MSVYHICWRSNPACLCNTCKHDGVDDDDCCIRHNSYCITQDCKDYEPEDRKEPEEEDDEG